MNFGPRKMRDQHRGHPRDQHLAAVDRGRGDLGDDLGRRRRHPRSSRILASSASANASSPTEREPLTRTASPGPISRSAAAAAAAGSGAHSSGP